MGRTKDMYIEKMQEQEDFDWGRSSPQRSWTITVPIGTKVPKDKKNLVKKYLDALKRLVIKKKTGDA